MLVIRIDSTIVITISLVERGGEGRGGDGGMGQREGGCRRSCARRGHNGVGCAWERGIEEREEREVAYWVLPWALLPWKGLLLAADPPPSGSQGLPCRASLLSRASPPGSGRL